MTDTMQFGRCSRCGGNLTNGHRCSAIGLLAESHATNYETPIIKNAEKSAIEIAREGLAIAHKATPGPWYIRHTDDHSHMTMTCVSCIPQPDRHDEKVYDNEPDTIAITWHQLRPTAGFFGSGGSDDNLGWLDKTRGNSDLIVHAGTNYATLCRAVIELQGKVDRVASLCSPDPLLLDFADKYGHGCADTMKRVKDILNDN